MITPQTEHSELAREIGVPRLYFKREDLHPHGSHKGRSIPSMIDAKAALGMTHFSVSSSGNAALAAARYIQERNAKGDCFYLSIFIGQNISPEKENRLRSEIHDEKITIIKTERPLQALFRIKRGSLRQSTDPLALAGYASLAGEISGTPELSDIFIGTSSGTTAQALADYFISEEKGVAIHIVQPADHSPIARDFDEEENRGEKTVTDAIVDRVVHRKDALTEAVRKTGGSGWIVSNERIRQAQKLLSEKAGIEATSNGALGLAGLLRAVSKGRKFKGAVVCIITGR